MAAPGFWDNQDKARVVVGEIKVLKSVIVPVEALVARSEDARVLLELAREENDADSFAELDEELYAITEELKRVELMTLLSGKNDACDCFFSIQAGAGGTEACDWAEMLLRMYLRYFERTKYKVEEIARTDGEEAGVRSITLKVRGFYAMGYLSCERGVHRLVRISPFDSNKRRHTSFAAVDVLPALETFRHRYTLGLVSNGNSYPERCGLDGVFRFVVFSQDHGVEKPDPEIFRIALQQAKCSPEQLLHVGDSLQNDVVGAAGTGIRGVWLNRNSLSNDTGVIPDYEIESLQELMYILK